MAGNAPQSSPQSSTHHSTSEPVPPESEAVGPRGSTEASGTGAPETAASGTGAPETGASGTEAPEEDGQRSVSSRTALKWSMLAQGCARAGQFALGIVLARILTPEDYGTYTVALGLFLILLTFDDLGVVKGLVRWPGSFEDAAPTARTIGVLSGLVVYALAFAIAPVIASIMSAPEATPVIRVLCLGVILDAAVQIVPTASLQRRFRQDLWVIVEFTRIVVLASVTLALAFAGLGVWALVWGALAGQLSLVVVTTVLARIPMTFGWNRAVAKELLEVSAPYAFAGLVSAVMLNIDYLVLGRHSGTVEVGIYLIAFNVSSWPTSLVGQSVRAVSIRNFAELEQQGADVGRSARRGLLLLFGGALPFVAVLIAMPELTIGTIYGSEWVSGAHALRFLAVLAIVRLVDSLSDDLFFALARPGWILAKNILWIGLLFVGLNIGAALDDVTGVAIAHALIAVLVILPLICVLLARLGVWTTRLPVLAGLMTLLGAVACFVGWLVVTHLQTPQFVTLVLGTLSVCVVFAAGLLPFRRHLDIA